MPFYLLRRITPLTTCGYDEAHGFVVCALNGSEARSIAADDAGDEGAGMWLDDAYTQCDELVDIPGTPAHVVLRDYRSA